MKVTLDWLRQHLDFDGGVTEVVDLHIWAMSTSQNALTAHLKRHPIGVDDMELLHQAKERLARLGIAHTTIQLEPPPGTAAP